MITSEASLAQGLLKALTQESLRAEYRANARRLAAQNHDPNQIHRLLHTVLAEAAWGNREGPAMNALQKRELELFRAFLQVCRQLKLPYFLVCGSALGAVKYQGFIPWDDDMDIAMLRPDYEVFLAQAPALLPRAHFFFKIIKPTRPFPPSTASSASPAPSSWKRLPGTFPFTRGIFIDLFPWTATRRSRPGSGVWSGRSAATAAFWPPPSPGPGLFPGPCSASWAVTGERRSLPPPMSE